MNARVKLMSLLFAAGMTTATLSAAPSANARSPEGIVIFAAASLKDALEDASAAWMKKSGHTVRISLAGSSKLAKQIQQGAPADLFISASMSWMNVLQKDGLIDVATRRDLLRNRIVLIAHGKNAQPVDIRQGFDLTGLVRDEKLAMAMVDAVPAGIYAKAAMTSLGIWDAVAAKVAQADNVRAALALVARGEAPYGIVYATDAAASDNVTIIGTFPSNSHPPIIYPAAVIDESRKKTLAKDFLAFLTSEASRPFLERQGFVIVEPTVAN
jgi:molybdate transport system substrate-binding protein